MPPEFEGPGEDRVGLRGSLPTLPQEPFAVLPGEEPNAVPPEHQVLVAEEVLPLYLPLRRPLDRVREVQGEVSSNEAQRRDVVPCFHRSAFYRFRRMP